MTDSRLFKPLSLGNMALKHRVGMCPLTRFRADDKHVPQPMMKEYYTQRASVPGTLLITEATFISPQQAGYPFVPGIWNDDQVTAWKEITDAVHAKGSYIWCQLWALGRTARPDKLAADGYEVLSSGNIPTSAEGHAPKPMTVEQIHQTIKDYAQAARNAIRAGFDGVEIHGANGYLVDQFTSEACNNRDDEYGGTIEKRSRFGTEVVKAVSEAVGPERTGIRLSPWSTFQGVRVENPVPQWSDLVKRIAQYKIAYLHLVEPRVHGTLDVEPTDVETLDFIYDLWDGPLLIAGGYTPERARKTVDEDRPTRDIVIMFGRSFIANPDLPFRVQKGLQLNHYDRQGFYAPGKPEGYVDQPFSPEFLETVKVEA